MAILAGLASVSKTYSMWKKSKALFFRSFLFLSRLIKSLQTLCSHSCPGPLP